jgi:PAS domain S-box-containing protein
MKKPEIPINESDRQAALERYSILDTLPEQEYDDLTQLAASICGTPIALVSLIDRDRQWFKSSVGLDASETPRDISFCGHVVANNEMLVITDTLQDERFADNPLVVNDPNIRFYAGLPLKTSDNFTLGTLCVIDRQPRDLTPLQIQQLKSLSRLVMSLLELRRNNEAANLLVSVQESSNKLSMLQQAILDSVNLAVISTDLQGTIQSFNSGAEAMLGYTSSEAIGKTPAIFHDINEIIDSSHQLSAELNQTIEAGFDVFIAKAKLGKVFEKEWTYICKNGDRIPVLLSITAIRNQQKEITGFLGVAKDITSQKEAERDRKRIEIELQRSEAALLEAQEIAHIGSWEFDIQSQKITWSPELFRMFGLDPNRPEPSYSDYLQLIHPEDSIRLHQCVEQANTHGTPYQIEYRPILPDGSIRYHEGKAGIERDEQGQVKRLFGTALDITDRAIAQMALEELNRDLEARVQQRTAALRSSKEALQISERRFRNFFNYAPIGIVVADVQTGQYIKVNSAFCQIVGYSEAELIDARSYESITMPEDWETQKTFNESLKGGEITFYQLEKRYIRKDGKAIICNLTTTIIRDEDGNITHLLKMVEDITERKQMESVLQRQMERQSFLMNITRQIRQSLNLNEILNTAVTEVKNLLNSDRVSIFRLFNDGRSGVVQETVDPQYPSVINRQWKDEDFSDHESFDYYMTSSPRIVNDVYKDNWSDCLAEFMAEAGVKSKIVAPIVLLRKEEEQVQKWQKGNYVLWGFLIVHACGEHRQWQQEEADLLQQVANQLAIAIQQSDIYERVASSTNKS